MKSPLLFLVVATIIFLASCLTANNNADAVIRIDFTKPGPQLSPTMYGVFFEDINHAADGGMYAELIQNRDLEYNRVPEDMRWLDDSTIVNPKGWKERYRRPADLFAWTLIQEGEAEAQMRLATENPLHPNNSHSLQVEITKLDNGRVGVANSGYWGIPVKKNGNYSLSFYARRSGEYGGSVRITLESQSGKEYASQELTGLTGSWTQSLATLRSNGDDPRARLVIYARSTGTIWLDMVSLFPEDTWKNRPQGLRKDLVEMLAHMNPSFVRFPGGCVVEGATLENRIQWKKTVGNIASRPGHWNLWGYRATDGMGFHEFLQLCEDLGAAPLYVINVGMSCQGRGGMVAAKTKIKDYLQEALDALEYAMGPVTTTWGAMRKANGHPEPFAVKYVEIGNENSGPDYQEAYKLIQAGIKQKYPQIITIANEAVPLSEQDKKRHPGVNLEMIDEHFYQSADFFNEQSTRYDAYDRSNPWTVYVGEFAVTAGDPGNGNLKAALGEAAFLIGLERNADIVKMASYAPTFVNVNDRRWNPNMIVYNTSQVYGTPSYHVVKMFSTHRPERVLATTVSWQIDSSAGRGEHLRGGIALSAWNTQAEFKDVQVSKDGNILFSDDFSKGVDRWSTKQDIWEVANGSFRNKNTVTEAIAVSGDTNWRDYTLTLKARKISGNEGFIIYFLMNGNNQCLWNLGGWGNTVDVLMQDRNASRVDIGKRREGRIETGTWYDIRIEVQGRRVLCYLDGTLHHDELLKEQFTPSLCATAGVTEKRGEVLLKIVNPSSTTKKCSVELDGSSGVQPEGDVIVLASANPADENSFGAPERVAPKTTILKGVGTTFEYACPPNSLSILRLKTLH